MRKKINISFLILVLCCCNLSLSAQTNAKKWFPYKNTNGQWSFRNEEGQQLGTEYFDTVSPFYYSEITRVVQKGIKGVLSVSGKLYIEPDFDTVIHPEKNIPPSFFIVGTQSSDEKILYGVQSSEGQSILKREYKKIDFVYNGSNIVGFSAQNFDSVLFGLFNLKGEQILPFEYAAIESQTSDYSVIRNVALLCKPKKPDNNNQWNYYSNQKIMPEWGLYSFLADSVIIPCNYTFYSITKTLSSIYNADWVIRLVPDQKYMLFEKYNSLSWDIYSMQGELLYTIDSIPNYKKPLDSYNNNQTRYYFDGRIFASTDRSTYISLLTDSIYRLSVNYKTLLYDLKKHSFLDTSRYKYFQEGFTQDYTIWDEQEKTSFKIDSLGNFYPDTLSSAAYSAKSYSMWQDFMMKVNKSYPDATFGNSFHLPNGARNTPVIQNKKYGLLNDYMKVVMPFDFKLITYSSASETIVVRKQKDGKIDLYNTQYKKIKSKFKEKNGTNTTERNGFLITHDKSDYLTIFDLRKNKFIYSEEKLSKNLNPKNGIVDYEIKIDILEYWDTLFYFQIYTPKDGFLLYDNAGKLLFQPEGIVLEEYNLTNLNSKDFHGFCYTIFDDNAPDKRRHKYWLSNGIKLEGLDAFDESEISLYRSYNNMYLAINNGYFYVFDQDGKKILEALYFDSDYRRNQSEYDYQIIVETKDGFNICDSNYHFLLESNFDKIKPEQGYAIGQRDSLFYIIRTVPKVIISPSYQKIRSDYRCNIQFAYHSDGSYDLINHRGEIITDGILRHEYIFNNLVAQSKTTEYWITGSGIIYGINELE